MRINGMAVLAAGVCMVALVTPAQAQERAFNIPAGTLRSALDAFGRQSGKPIIYKVDEIRGLRTSGYRGTANPQAALDAILARTGFTARVAGSGAVAIVKGGNGQAVDNAPAAGAVGPQRVSENQEDTEIVVTAQKREERLQDVPVPVTVLRADTLLERNQLLIRDYFISVPGLNVVPSIQSNQTLSIRGITTGIGNPTVGVTVDDVPYGASTNNGGGRVIPDIDPGDLAQVEVLRGPQGTLYGASSLGGLLKFVTRDPSTAGFTARLQGGLSGVHNGSEPGFNVRGSFNLPLSDTLASSVSAFVRRDPGFIDNAMTGESGVNSAYAYGARVAALWKPSPDLSVKLSALFQQIEGDGASSVDPALGDLRQSRIVGTGWYDRRVQAYSMTVTADLGGADLTSITGYNVNSFADSLDGSFAYVSGAQGAQALFGVAGAELLSETETKKFTQELRLASPTGNRLEWLIGLFYTREHAEIQFDRLAVNPTTGVSVGRLQFSTLPDTYREYAAFGNLTFHVTDRFDIQFGARQSYIRERFDQTVISAQGVATANPQLNTEGSAFTYLVTPRFQVNSNLMIYARLASGYRAGGPNPFPGGVVPVQYQPDKTQNYEVGIKGDLLDRALSFDASLYYIDWKDIQFSSLSAANRTYFVNGSRAKSQGVELSLVARPTRGLSLNGWVAYNDAVLTEPFPTGSTGFGLRGDRLPNSSRWSWHLSAQQEFPLLADLDGYVGGSASYVGDRIGPFRGVALRQFFPAYTQVDLRAGVKSDSWSANFFVTNATDQRGALYGGLGASPATAFAYTQPRTIGLSLLKNF